MEELKQQNPQEGGMKSFLLIVLKLLKMLGKGLLAVIDFVGTILCKILEAIGNDLADNSKRR